jgi:hypothetical protein
MCLAGSPNQSEGQRTKRDLNQEIPSSNPGKGKVKVTLEQAMKAQRGSRGIAVLFD